MPSPKKTRGRKPELGDAIVLATSLHKGQVDKVGEPYILHPLAVMLKGKCEKERIVGVLHDVLEDCLITKEDLRKLDYSEEILEALDLLTKRPEEEKNYSAFIDSGNRLAISVKINDIRNNLDPDRFARKPTERNFKRRDKYLIAIIRLNK